MIHPSRACLCSDFLLHGAVLAFTLMLVPQVHVTAVIAPGIESTLRQEEGGMGILDTSVPFIRKAKTFPNPARRLPLTVP